MQFIPKRSEESLFSSTLFGDSGVFFPVVASHGYKLISPIKFVTGLTLWFPITRDHAAITRGNGDC